MKAISVIPDFPEDIRKEVFSLYLVIDDEDTTREIAWWFSTTISGSAIDAVFDQIERAITRNLYNEIVGIFA